MSFTSLPCFSWSLLPRRNDRLWMESCRRTVRGETGLDAFRHGLRTRVSIPTAHLTVCCQPAPAAARPLQVGGDERE